MIISIIAPYLILRLRIYRSVKSNDTFLLNVTEVKSNKEYLFTYLFTVLLPLYSVAITNKRDFSAMIVAICFVIFVLWNMNLHFINILLALQGYKVYTIESHDCAVLLTRRVRFAADLKELKVHRLSNSVFIELNNYSYGN